MALCLSSCAVKRVGQDMGPGRRGTNTGPTTFNGLAGALRPPSDLQPINHDDKVSILSKNGAWMQVEFHQTLDRTARASWHVQCPMRLVYG